MPIRNNAARFQFECRDPDESLRKLWDRVQATAPTAVRARLEEARKLFPDIPFDEDVASNGVLFRHVCEYYLKHHS